MRSTDILLNALMNEFCDAASIVTASLGGFLNAAVTYDMTRPGLHGTVKTIGLNATKTAATIAVANVAASTEDVEETVGVGLGSSARTPYPDFCNNDYFYGGYYHRLCTTANALASATAAVSVQSMANAEATACLSWEPIFRNLRPFCIPRLPSYASADASVTAQAFCTCVSPSQNENQFVDCIESEVLRLLWLPPSILLLPSSLFPVPLASVLLLSMLWLHW